MKSLFNVINAKKVQLNKKDTAIIIGKVMLVIFCHVSADFYAKALYTPRSCRG